MNLPAVTAVAFGVGIFLLLCLVSILAGRGLLRMLRIACSDEVELALAPCLTLAFWSCCLAMFAGLRIAPLKYATLALWLVTLLLVAIGCRTRLRDPRSLWPIGVSLLSSIVLMAPYFWNGLTEYQGSVAPDGWSYVAYADYLWNQVRGAQGSLSPLHQFAAHLSGTRYVSASLLAFLSPLAGAGNPAAVKVLLQAWTLFVYGAAIAFLWLAVGWPRTLIVPAVALTIVCGWTANLIWVNNLDNGLALVYSPALAGSLRLMHAARPARLWAVVGMLVGALLYTYPEFVTAGLVTAFLVALPHIWRDRQAWSRWLTGLATALALGVVLVLPYLPELVSFALAQIQITTARPGEGLFSGLVGRTFQPSALWGLGGEHQLVIEHQNLMGLVLSLLALTGAAKLLRDGEWGLVVSAALLCAGAAYFLLQHRYPYGAYKFILLVWFILVAMLVTGFAWLTSQISRANVRRATVGLVSVGAAGVAVWSNHTGDALTARFYPSPNQHYGHAQLASVTTAARLAGGGPIVALIDDWLAQEWATYYLRDQSLALLSYRMYMAQPHVVPLMAQSKSINFEDVRYLLTDAPYDRVVADQPGWTMVWADGPYRLWSSDSPDWTVITDVANANGLERKDGEPFFWLGNGDSVVDIVTTRAGALELVATFVPGPSLAPNVDPTINVRTSWGFSSRLAVAPGERAITVPVPSGKTRVMLQSEDRPAVAVLPSGDSRPLLVGVKGLAVRRECSVSLDGAANDGCL